MTALASLLRRRQVAHRKVHLYKYIPLESGWRYCRASFYENNRIKPHMVLTPQPNIKDLEKTSGRF
jgi:hypothetical protein